MTAWHSVHPPDRLLSVWNWTVTRPAALSCKPSAPCYSTKEMMQPLSNPPACNLFGAAAP